MAARKVYHVATSEKGGWTVKAETNTRPSSTHTTKSEAVTAAKVLAKKSGLGAGHRPRPERPDSVRAHLWQGPKGEHRLSPLADGGRQTADGGQNG